MQIADQSENMGGEQGRIQDFGKGGSKTEGGIQDFGKGGSKTEGEARIEGAKRLRIGRSPIRGRSPR